MVSQGCSVTALKCYSVTVLQCLSLTGQHDVVISRFNLDNKYIYKCSVSTDIYNIFIFMIKICSTLANTLSSGGARRSVYW